MEVDIKFEKSDDTFFERLGIEIIGMDQEYYEVTILGVEYYFYEEEFPHHVKAYMEMYK